MMLGAFDAAIDDCDTAIKLVRDYNPLTVSSADREELISMLKVDSGLTLMTKLLARMGRALLKVGRCEEADSTLDQAIRVAILLLDVMINAAQVRFKDELIFHRGYKSSPTKFGISV